MARDGTLGSLLQGVSQQPPAVRPSGKVSEQINFISDVVQGLTSRPALTEHALITDVSEQGLDFFDAVIEGTRYIVGYSAGVLRVWDTQGVEQTITTTPTDLAYIGADMRDYVFENDLFLVNRDVVVATAAVTGTTDIFEGVGLVTVLGGIFSRTYSITIKDPTGSTTVSYTTPDGTASGDAAKTAATYIVDQLFTSLTTWINTTVTATSSTAADVAGKSGNTVYLRYPGDTLTIVVSDGDTQNTIRAHTATADDVTALADTAPHGSFVRIVGVESGDADDYYLRFNSATTDTVGLGFGDEGIWEEWYNYEEPTDFDLTTMPHVLQKTGPTTFNFGTGSWANRRVGDEETNAFSDIVGHAIRDIGGFKSRIVFVAGPYCAMSRTNNPFDFFKSTALSELDTDPISITSTEEGSLRLDWIIPFDRDLVLVSDPGEGQFVITGSSILTPGNASMVKTTAFEMRGGAKPVQTGRTVLLPFKSGRYSGLNEFFTNDDVATNGADNLTETLDQYVVGLINKMECSTNFNTTVIKTDDGDFSTTLWIYKFLWSGTDKVQSSWSKWVMPNKVNHFFFTGSQLFVVMENAGDTTSDYIVTSLDLDRPLDPVANFHINLDRQYQLTADGSSGVTLPYTAAAFVQGSGCATPGRQVYPISETPTASGVDYVFDDETVPIGAGVIGGLRYTRSISPTMPYLRGQDGQTVPRTHIVVGGFMLQYEDTGYVKYIMDCRYRADPIEASMDWFPLDNDPADPFGNGMRSGTLHIPWGERNDWSELTLTSDDVRPTTFIELQWVGHGYKGSRG